MKLIGWIILTMPIWAFGAATLSVMNREPGQHISNASFWAAAIFFVPIWWGIYFLTEAMTR
jgi:hypothetical protein